MRGVLCVLLCVVVFWTGSVLAQETCCHRSVTVAPIAMPPEQTAYDYGGMMSAGFASPLLDDPFGIGDCPLDVGLDSYEGTINFHNMIEAIGKATGVAPDPHMQELRAQLHNMSGEYYFRGSVEVANPTIIEGKVYGVFTLTMQLVENCPGRNLVLKEEQTTWDGSNYQIAGEGGLVGRVAGAALEELGQRFMPLDEIIDEYETTPETCRIEPDKDRVKVGETITVTVSGIKDRQGRTPEPFDVILVKAEKGEIINGVENGWLKRFQVGGGSVTIEYKALDECPEEKTDTITVENSCERCAPRYVNFTPEQELATREIEITCQMALEYMHQVTFSSESYQETNTVTGSVSFDIEDNQVDAQGSVAISTSGVAEDCTIEGSGSNQVHITGQLVPREGDLPELQLSLEETWYSSYQKIMTCPDRDPVTLPINPQEQSFDLTMPLENGHTETQPFTGQGGSGTYQWTLREGN